MKTTFLILTILVCSCIIESALCNELSVSDEVFNITSEDLEYNNITDYCVCDSMIYILDAMLSEITIVNYKTNSHITSYGSKGNGPGEFVLPKRIFSYKNNIYVWDEKKKCIIEFNNDQYLNEYSNDFLKQCHNCEFFSLKNQIYIQYDIVYFNENSTYIEKKIASLNSDFTIGKKVHLVSSKIYNPYYFNFSGDKLFSMNNNFLSIYTPDINEINFDFIDLNSNRKFAYNEKFPKQRMRKKKREALDEYADYLKSYYVDKNVEIESISNYENSVTSMYLSSNGFLYFLNNINNRNLLHRYNPVNNKITSCEIDLSGEIRIINNHLFILNQTLDYFTFKVIKINQN